MSVLSYIRSLRKNSAATAGVAKERLQIIIAHERSQRGGPDYLPALKNDIIDVIAKYISIDKDQVKVQFDREGDSSVLELNIVLPEIELTV